MAPVHLLHLFTTFVTSAASCPPVPLYEQGRVVAVLCADSVPRNVMVLELGDEWAPRLFSETLEQPQTYRSTFVALANEQLGTTKGWRAARRDRYYELFGVFPSIRVIAARLEDGSRHGCHASVDDAPLIAMMGQPPRSATAVGPAVAAVVHQRLRCEGLLPPSAASGTVRAVNPVALALYQRRHMIPAGGRFDEDTRRVLLEDSRELDFRTLLRTLRERVVDSAGLIEDGSAANAWEPVLGRHLEAAEYRARLRTNPLPHGAPDLTARATEAAALALGWTSADAAEASLRQGLPARVAVRWQPPPLYHLPHMQLRAEIDRGDVWVEPPLDASGKAQPSPARRRPTLVLYAVTPEGEVALVRWPTTIGGWHPEKVPDGSVELQYKPSPVGRRYWRDLLAAPAWFPPGSTPDQDLVRRVADGTWQTDDDAIGPGYRSAYGLMALLHHRAQLTAAGTSAPGNVFTDVQIRTHGSGNYRSILRGSSHGCHRLFNHLAIRLGSFLLRHRDHRRHGAMAEDYARSIDWEGQRLVLRAKNRGYRYELVPPLPVDVLPGRTVRSRRPLPVPTPPLAQNLVSRE
jgi:hypothetical protein